MASFVIRLLMVLELGSIFVWGSVFQSKDCGRERLSYLRPYSDFELFYVNGRAVDTVWFCQKLEFYYRNGCFCDSDGEEWRSVGDKCCNLQLSVSESGEFIHPADLPQRSGRKLLPELRINDFLSPSTEEEHPDALSLSSKNMVMAASGMALLSCVLVCPCFRARKKATAHSELSKEPKSSKEPNSMDSVSSVEATSNIERIPPSPLRVPPSPSRFSSPQQLSRVGSVHLNVSQVLKATRNFSPALQIGEGGFGTVYKAHLQDGQVVAIKRAKKEHFDSLRTEFSSEVELLAKIEHRNLVKLLGYVDKGTERIIITEFVPNGTLREHLDGQHGKILDFNQRLEISIDVAHALTYLHLYAEKPIIHRDVKSSNILLTESYRAKVADFGFARLGPMDADQTHISTKVKGTAGYLDPEYLKTYQLTPKSDVYSFGILLVEILSARRPVELKRSADERVTIRWAFKKYNEGSCRDVLDPSMLEEVDEGILSKMLSLAFQCAAPTRPDRPTMKEVGEQLWAIRIDHLRSVRRG